MSVFYFFLDSNRQGSGDPIAFLLKTESRWVWCVFEIHFS